MPRSHKSIHRLSVSVWGKPYFKDLIDRELWSGAREAECIHPQQPVDNRVTVWPSRLHADLSRVLKGEPVKFKETRAALAVVQEELNAIGFVPANGQRYVRSDELGVVGEIDADGFIDELGPVIIEVKCVRFLPQVARAADAAQLLLYSMARNPRQIDAPVLLVVYVQPAPPFRTAIRVVFNTETIAPIVRQLALAS